MSYLLDTCALSELIKPAPRPQVVEWFDAVDPEVLFISVLTLGEIRKGVERLPSGLRRERIGAWLELKLPAWFEDRILAVDAGVADEWGRLTARCPRTLPAVDALLASTALRHRLSLVTHNVADFQGTGLAVINPWDG